MSVEKFLPHDEQWLDAWDAFAKEFLDPKFTLIKTEYTISGKPTVFNRKPITELQMKTLPETIQTGKFSLSIKLNSIDYTVVEEGNRKSRTQRTVLQAKLGGAVHIEGKLTELWTLEARMGQIIQVTNLRNLHTIMPGNIPVFQIRSINRNTNSVTIGPIKKA